MKQESSKPKRPLNNHQQLIKKFVTVEFSLNKSSWPQQMKIAGQLLKKYSIEFMLWCPIPNNYKVTSMVWFLTEEGKHFLSDQLVEYSKQNINLYPEKPKEELSPQKIGEDIFVESKPKTLQEFLNYGKKIRQQRSESSTASRTI